MVMRDTMRSLSRSVAARRELSGAGQDRAEKIERKTVAVGESRCLPAQCEVCLLLGSLHGAAHDAGDRLERRIGRRLVTGPIVLTEGRVDHRADGPGVDGTRDHERHILGRVEPPIELFQIGLRRRVHRLQGSQHRPAIRMAREHHAVQLPNDGGPRRVGLDARLLEDDLTLGVDLLRGERRAERHGVQQLDRPPRRLAGDEDLKRGVVGGGERVGASTGALDGAIDVAGAERIGPLE